MRRGRTLLPGPRPLAPMNEQLPKHPIGTFALLLVYVALFVAGWMAIYLYLYLGRGGVST